VSGARGFTRFIGVSLGGGRGKTTAVARLECGADEAATMCGWSRPACVTGTAAAARTATRTGGDPLFRDEVLVAYLERHVDEQRRRWRSTRR
jgi:hypothetical protein